jgi:hypothetical protein
MGVRAPTYQSPGLGGIHTRTTGGANRVTCFRTTGCADKLEYMTLASAHNCYSTTTPFLI